LQYFRLHRGAQSCAIGSRTNGFWPNGINPAYPKSYTVHGSSFLLRRGREPS
jgi:hypothetical protein